ncbi:MAG: hypothetical protein ACTH29_05965 [Fusobacterium sp.]
MNTTTNIVTSLIGTCVGGAISYFVIYQSEKNKRKKDFELKAVSKVLIPLGEIIEYLINNMNKKRYNDIKFEDYFEELNELSIYLTFEKDFFLKDKLVSSNIASADIYIYFSSNDKKFLMDLIHSTINDFKENVELDGNQEICFNMIKCYEIERGDVKCLLYLDG